MVQEDKGEEEHPCHHGEGAGIVRVGTLNEPLILQVGEGTHGHLQCVQVDGCEWVVSVSIEGGMNLIFQEYVGDHHNFSRLNTAMDRMDKYSTKPS